MTYEELMREFDEIVKAIEALTRAANMSIPEIIAGVARIQVRQVKILSYLMVEVERLKVQGGKR